MADQYLIFDKRDIFHPRATWHRTRRVDSALLVHLDSIAPVERTITPTEATIAVATEAPAILDEDAVAPTEATITVATEAPTILKQIVVSPADPADIDVSTEAPTFAQLERTISPTSEATIELPANALPTWVTVAGTKKIPYMLRRTRMWTVYASEAYGKDIVYRRTYAFPILPERKISAASEATITLELEAPSLSVTAGTQISVSPASVSIALVTEAPTLVRTNPNNSVIGVERRHWAQRTEYVTTYRRAHPLVPGARRPVYQVHERQVTVYKTPRAQWYDFFATTQRFIIPGIANISVNTETPGLQFEGVRDPETGVINVITQSPQLTIDGATQFDETIVTLARISRRRRFMAARQEFDKVQEMPTRIIAVFVQATPDTLRAPDSVSITVETEAPTVTFLNQTTVSPAQATLTVETEAPTLDSQVEDQPSVGTIQVVTEAPTVVGAIGTRTIVAASAARLTVETDAPGLTGISTVVFPGENGIDTTSVTIETSAPTLRLLRWTKEAKAVDNWSAESAATDDWEKLPKAASGWNKV